MAALRAGPVDPAALLVDVGSVAAVGGSGWRGRRGVGLVGAGGLEGGGAGVGGRLCGWIVVADRGGGW